jgi:hypothetical protein
MIDQSARSVTQSISFHPQDADTNQAIMRTGPYRDSGDKALSFLKEGYLYSLF